MYPFSLSIHTSSGWRTSVVRPTIKMLSNWLWTKSIRSNAWLILTQTTWNSSGMPMVSVIAIYISYRLCFIVLINPTCTRHYGSISRRQNCEFDLRRRRSLHWLAHECSSIVLRTGRAIHDADPFMQRALVSCKYISMIICIDSNLQMIKIVFMYLYWITVSHIRV